MQRAAQDGDIEGLQEAVAGFQNLSRGTATRPGSRGLTQTAAAQPEQAVAMLEDAQTEEAFGRIAEGTGQNAGPSRSGDTRAGEELATRPETVTRKLSQQDK